MKKSLKEKINTAPLLPGVYLFKNQKNKVLYIGKASNLKNRLTSYLNSTFMDQAEDIDTIITNSDVEALTLEESLIKLHKPKYNIRLRDDKKFPYLKVTIKDDFPRILFTRDLKDDGSLIFGPYTNAKALRRTRDALCRIFKLVSCTKDLSRKYTRPCLEYYLGRCSAPCTQSISKEEYTGLVDKGIKFLRGSSDELEKSIEAQMWKYSEKENFEAAKILRDQLFAIRKISQRQQIVTEDNISRDVIGTSRTRSHCTACLFRIRENRLFSKEIYELKITPKSSDEEIASAFIRLIYTHISFLPQQIVIAATPGDWDIQARWFQSRDSKVQIVTRPKSAVKNILDWAKKNADNEMSTKAGKHRVSPVLLEIQERLQLGEPPRWIEGFDVSNLGDKFAVGSSVAFKDGKPFKQYYRRYRIRRIGGQDDFAMIRQIVSRRLKDIQGRKRKPNLLLIDGGKGQLSSALRVIRDLDTDIPTFALAKRSDELYDQRGNVISIPQTAKGFYLLKRLRDEAHRFAIGYHRKLRGKQITKSVLDSIDGIGKSRKYAILKYFGSIEALRKASDAEIAKIPGIGPHIAKRIYEALHT
ncbi:MAG: excinuclease ABC subunit UvrC [candidate division WOR-3 bacterium]|nr:MAG: excinuclease ABC subunit UvrC [candidate division WOR-3 bacterium]